MVITYQLDSTDLTNYRRIQEYVPGKKNPFSTIMQEETQTNSTENNQNGGNSENSGNNNNNANSGTSNNTTNANNNNETGYLPNKGLK